MTVAAAIRDKISRALQPSHVELVDDSARHAGHAGAREGGETHFNLLVVAAAFAGHGRVARQRMVYAALAEELAGPVHALAVRALTPEEARAAGMLLKPS
ncbi:MAG: BolA family protein [Alphaproteobacteria bacterium]